MSLSMRWPEVGLVGLLFNCLGSFMASLEMLVSNGIFFFNVRGSGWEKTAPTLLAGDRGALQLCPSSASRSDKLIQYLVPELVLIPL